MANRLAQETSPYLLQHAQNPVDWYAWGPEALQRARDEQRPIFLSIGYSACHWCHVMEHESFEDPEIAQILNDSFVCIKVDREERPDLDQIYMNAVQILTGRGGWPMSVFLTPDLRPFHGGTYWPPRSRMGMPGFDQVLRAVLDAWTQRRTRALDAAEELTARIREIGAGSDVQGALTEDALTAARTSLERIFDFRNGGFGGAPKFPHAMDLQILLRWWQRTGDSTALDMVRLNLDKMAAGGIYDHLAGGFARYSVDEKWLVPHFEKMLYDNALLAGVYLEAFQATAHADYARVVQETLDYILAYMTDPQGGFHSTEDADSEGEEGKFYVWTPAQICEVLGAESGELFCRVYDVTEAGNFEGHNILNLPKSLPQFAGLTSRDLAELEAELAEARRRLLAHRDQRVRPGKDDKILTSWNALMIETMARAAAQFDSPRYRAGAERAMNFLLTQLRQPDGRLLHSWRLGQARLAAYLDDYAYTIQALITLYETTWQESWLSTAVELADDMLARFRDAERGGFYFTADDHEQLIARNKDFYDSSVPSGNGMAATALVRLGRLTGNSAYQEAARETLSVATGVMQQSATAAGQLLLALDLELGPLHEIAILGGAADPELSEIQRELWTRFWPRRVVAFRDPSAPTADDSPLNGLFAGKTAPASGPAVFVCEHFSCQAPVCGAAEARLLFERLAAPREK